LSIALPLEIRGPLPLVWPQQHETPGLSFEVDESARFLSGWTHITPEGACNLPRI